jgi:hypothetical protein
MEDWSWLVDDRVPESFKSTMPQQVRLDHEQVGYGTVVSRASREFVETAWGDLELRMTAAVLSHNLGVREFDYTTGYTYKTPASWWQSFKLSAINDGNPFFKSAGVRWVEKTVTKTHMLPFSTKAIYPEANINAKLGKPVILYRPVRP